MWKVVFFDGLEEPFKTQADMPKVVPQQHTVIYDHSQARPEMDAKISPQPEVFPDGGRQSAVGFLPYKTFKWWSYTDPITVSAGLRTRAKAALMIVCNGIDGDHSRPGACGMTVGIAPADVLDPLSGAIVWSDWWVVRDTLDNERVWHLADTPEWVPEVGQVRLWIRCHADVAAAISAGHWDAECIEQYVDDGGGGVTEARVLELISQSFPGLYAMHETQTMARLARAIQDEFPV
jgi:hypothetical protein